MHGSSELFADFVSVLPARSKLASSAIRTISPSQTPSFSASFDRSSRRPSPSSSSPSRSLPRFPSSSQRPIPLISKDSSSAPALPPLPCAEPSASSDVIWLLCSRSYRPGSPEPSWSPDRTRPSQSWADFAVPSILYGPQCWSIAPVLFLPATYSTNSAASTSQSSTYRPLTTAL
jgi:hypothetical protein